MTSKTKSIKKYALYIATLIVLSGAGLAWVYSFFAELYRSDKNMFEWVMLLFVTFNIALLLSPFLAFYRICKKDNKQSKIKTK